MKQSCPKCKTIIEIDEKKYYPGSQVEVQCPLCDGKVTFAIPAKAENCAEAHAKLNETVSNLQMQIDEMRKASGEEKSTLALKALEDRISRLEYLIQELQYEVNHRRDNVKDERTGTTKNDGDAATDKRKKQDRKGLRTIVVLGLLLLLIVCGMLFIPRMCHNNTVMPDTVNYGYEKYESYDDGWSDVPVQETPQGAQEACVEEDLADKALKLIESASEPAIVYDE